MDNGTYRARAVTAALGETKAGHEQVGIEFEFLDLDGQRLTYFGSFSDKAIEHTLKALRTAGWQGDDLADYSSIGRDAPEVSLVIEAEEWEGKSTPKIRWVNPPGGGPAMRSLLSQDKARAFASRMRGAVLSFNRSSGAVGSATKGTGSSQGRREEPPPPTDSDRPPF